VSLRQQLRQLRQIERQYSMNGLTGQERSDLQLRIRNLRQQVRYAEGGRGGQYGQSGQYDRDYDDDDRYSNGGYDNRGYDNRGYDNRGYGRDDGYQGGYQQPTQQGGIGGIIGGILGTGGLRVGQRASGNLYAVPYEYRASSATATPLISVRTGVRSTDRRTHPDGGSGLFDEPLILPPKAKLRSAPATAGAFSFAAPTLPGLPDTLYHESIPDLRQGDV
jgi:hypothetical protein